MQTPLSPTRNYQSPLNVSTIASPKINMSFYFINLNFNIYKSYIYYKN